MPEESDSCAVAHGTAPAVGTAPARGDRTLVVVFGSPLSGFLLA